MNEQRIKYAQQHLVETLDNAAVAKGGDVTLESLRDALAAYSFHHPLFRLLAFAGFGKVENFIETFQPAISAVTVPDQFTTQLMGLLDE